jgi:hypothetical protein
LRGRLVGRVLKQVFTLPNLRPSEASFSSELLGTNNLVTLGRSLGYNWALLEERAEFSHHEAFCEYLWRSVSMKTKQKASKAGPTPVTPVPAVTPETEVTEATAPTSPISWFTQATIVLALIPFVGYWCALSFEKGFCAYFGIPAYFISLSPTQVLGNSTIWFLIVPAICLVIAVAIGWALLAEANKYVGLVLPIAFVILLVWRKYEDFKDIKTLLGMVVVILLGVLLFWLTDGGRKINRASIPRKSRGILGIVGAFFLIVLGYGYMSFFALGLRDADNQTEFPTIAPQSSTVPPVPEIAVIRNYGEYLLAVPLKRDSNGNGFEKKLILLKMSEGNPKILTMEEVGPLRPKPIEPPAASKP